MIKYCAIALMLFGCVAHPKEGNSQVQVSTSVEPVQQESAIYSFKIPALEGGVIDLSKFKGQKILIVNTASECGYTPQYKELQELAEKYKGKLVVIGFPANDFGKQEPGTAQEIKAFCEKNYGVSFPMAAKVSVKGDDMAPIYQWLTSKERNGVLDATIGWNLNKFLIDENGNLMAHFPSKVTPLSQEIVSRL